MMMTTTQSLIEEYLGAKKAEDNLKERRRDLARQIAEQIDHPEEGQCTREIGRYKVSVKANVNRKVDWKALDALGLVEPPYRVKRELDLVGLRWHEREHPDLYPKIAKCITATPGAIEIEIREKEEK